MYTCHNIPFGGRVRLGRDGRIFGSFRVFFFLVVEDHLVVADNYYRVAVAPPFVASQIEDRSLCLFGHFSPDNLVFATKRIPLGPRNQSTKARCFDGVPGFL